MRELLLPSAKPAPGMGHKLHLIEPFLLSFLVWCCCGEEWPFSLASCSLSSGQSKYLQSQHELDWETAQG